MSNMTIKVYIGDELEFETKIPSLAMIYGMLRNYHEFSKEKTNEALAIIWDAYMKDFNFTPIIDLIDFVAFEFDTLKDKDIKSILRKFYQTLEDQRRC